MPESDDKCRDIQETLRSTYGDGWFAGFLYAQSMDSDELGECGTDDIVLISERAEGEYTTT